MKLLVLSMVCFLKPLLFLMPLLYTTRDILPVIYSINHSQPLGRSDIAKVVKLLLLLFVAYIASNLLSALPSLAALCFLAAGACFVVSTNEDMIKLLAPHLAPYFSSLHTLIVASLANGNISTSLSNSSSNVSNTHTDSIALHDATTHAFRFAGQLSETLRRRTSSWEH